MQTEYQTLWNKCLAVIKDIVPEAAFNTWFKPIIPLSYEDNKFTIQVPSQFFLRVSGREVCERIESYFISCDRTGYDIELSYQSR